MTRQYGNYRISSRTALTHQHYDGGSFYLRSTTRLDHLASREFFSGGNTVQHMYLYTGQTAFESAAQPHCVAQGTNKVCMCCSDLVHIRTPANLSLGGKIFRQMNLLNTTGTGYQRDIFYPASSPTTYLSGVANRTGITSLAYLVSVSEICGLSTSALRLTEFTGLTLSDTRLIISFFRLNLISRG